MTETSSLLTMAADAARHAALRQTVIARNIANSDTPGYAARDLVDFASLMQRGGGDFVATATRTGHAGAASGLPRDLMIRDAAPGTTTPDGNSVALEDQMVRAADARRQHDLALTLYRKSIDLMRLGLGRAR